MNTGRPISYFRELKSMHRHVRCVNANSVGYILTHSVKRPIFPTRIIYNARYSTRQFQKVIFPQSGMPAERDSEYDYEEVRGSPSLSGMQLRDFSDE